MTTTLLPDKSKVSRFFPAIMMTLSQVILYLFSNLSTRKGNLPASLLRRHALSNRSRGQNHALKPHPSTPPTTAPHHHGRPIRPAEAGELHWRRILAYVKLHQKLQPVHGRALPGRARQRTRGCREGGGSSQEGVQNVSRLLTMTLELLTMTIEPSLKC